jgi:hypothetical protein
MTTSAPFFDCDPEEPCDGFYPCSRHVETRAEVEAYRNWKAGSSPGREEPERLAMVSAIAAPPPPPDHGLPSTSDLLDALDDLG